VGWFGVLADTARPEDFFRVSSCHLNWWALPTLAPGRRLFLLDIGLHVSAPPAKELPAITLVLPVDLESVRWDGAETMWVQDLYDALHQRDICSQVFGERVEIHDTDNGYRVDFPGGSRLDIVRILAAQAGRLNGSTTSRPDLSIWTIPLESPIPAGASRYVRFRVSVFTAGTVWRWKTVWFGKSGAQIDFRLADVREAMREERERQYWARVVPIEQLNVFFMVPPAFQARVASPALHYVRLLEAGQWGAYLRGARYRAPVRGLRVHYWRHPTGAPPASSLVQSTTPDIATTGVGTATKQQSPITIDDPFRIFLDLSRDIAIPASVSMLRTVLAVIIAIVIFHVCTHLVPIHLSWPRHFSTILTWILGSSVIAVFGALAKYWRIIISRFRTARLVLRRVERGFLKPFIRS
jgi:hypothetical protein